LGVGGHGYGHTGNQAKDIVSGIESKVRTEALPGFDFLRFLLS
jgi:hypothetical protein